MSRLRHTAITAVAFLVSIGTAAAHGGSLRSATGGSLAVPAWLFLLTGGAIVGVSFLLASFVTDRALVRVVHGWSKSCWIPGTGALTLIARTLGVFALLAVLAIGFVGPEEPLANLAVLLVWGGWWAGFTATTYLIGNAWPVLNPWRTLVAPLPSLDREIEVGVWPAVVGLLALVWLEVVSPVADDPRLLTTVVLSYTVVTLAGAVIVGPARWFRSVDPPSGVFRLYGAMAPFVSVDGDIRLRLPGAGLVAHDLPERGGVAFVVALLWATTFDGLVTTPLWDALARMAVGAGVPAVLLYPAILAAGFFGFLRVFRLAVRRAHTRTRTYLDPTVLARRFAPPLVAIAAGYHLAHYLGYFLQLLPALLAAFANPLAPGTPTVLVLPSWFGGVELAFVLFGHLLAIGVAHAVAFDLFPGRLQAIRSQYPLTVVMVAYTMVSLWIVSQPFVQPPYV